MSDPVNNFGQGGWTQQGSQNAGQWQAQTNQNLSPQQQGESQYSYQTRQAAYNNYNQNK